MSDLKIEVEFSDLKELEITLDRIIEKLEKIKSLSDIPVINSHD